MNDLGYKLIRMPSFDHCKTQEMSCPNCRRWHWVCDCDLDELVERGLMPAYDVDPGSQFDYWDGSWEFMD